MKTDRWSGQFYQCRMTAAALVLSGLLTLDCCADEAAERLFALQVAPLLKDKCLGCHGGDADNIKGEFKVLSREDLLHGGESEEPGIVPGKPEEGSRIEAITWAGLEMPPKENDRLNESQIDLIRAWIAAGAPWPEAAVQAFYRHEESARMITEDGMIVPTSGGSSAIDYFVDRQLVEHEMTPSAPASPLNLIRRASFDLIGLPPTPEEIAAFENEHAKDADQAWSALLERLLDSPRYGEHWARHWLDVTR